MMRPMDEMMNAMNAMTAADPFFSGFPGHRRMAPPHNPLANFMMPGLLPMPNMHMMDPLGAAGAMVSIFTKYF